MNEREELTTYQHIDRMARETALLAMELARFCLTSHSLQTSERELAIRVREAIAPVRAESKGGMYYNLAHRPHLAQAIRALQLQTMDSKEEGRT